MYDESVDVYAFGMCLLEMVTGEYPYTECQFPAQIYRKVTTGVKPECFNRIPQQYPEIREIIDRCIRVRREERSTVKQLLADDFFTPEELIGIRVEIKNRDLDLAELNVEIQMQLRVYDEKKRKQYRFKENEGLQFAFDIENDTAEEVVQQMIEQQHIPDEDTKMITKLIKDKVESFKRDREFKIAELKRQREEEERQREEQAIKEEMKARAKEKERLEAEQRESASAASATVNTEPTQPLSSQQPVVSPPMASSTLPSVQQTTATATSAVPTDKTAQQYTTSVPPSDDFPDAQTISAHEEKKKAKRKIVLEVLKVDDAKDQPLVSCKLDTAHKTVTFQFAPDSDKPSVIAEKLLAENCLAQHHVAIVEDQLEQIIALVNKGVGRVVGTKLTTVVETQTTTTTSTQNISSGPSTARTGVSPAPVSGQVNATCQTTTEKVSPSVQAPTPVPSTVSQAPTPSNTAKATVSASPPLSRVEPPKPTLQSVAGMSRSVDGDSSTSSATTPIQPANVPQSSSVHVISTASSTSTITAAPAAKPSRFQVTPSVVSSMPPAPHPTTTVETTTLPSVSQAQAQQLSPPAPAMLSNGSSPSTTAHSNTSSVTSNASTGSRFKVQSVPVQATLAPTSSVESGFSSSTSTHTEASMSSMGSASTPIAVQPPITTNVAATMTVSGVSTVSAGVPSVHGSIPEAMTQSTTALVHQVHSAHPALHPTASLPHTPAHTGEIATNLAGLSEKLAVLSQIQQQQREEQQVPHPVQQPQTTLHQLPASQPSQQPKEEDEHVSSQTTASGTDELHVDTLNGLAQALQKLATTCSLPCASVAATSEDESPSPERRLGLVMESNGTATQLLPSNTAPDLTQRLRAMDSLAAFKNLESALSCTLGTSSMRPSVCRDDASTHRDDVSSMCGSSAMFHVGTPPLFSPVPTSESDFDCQAEDEDDDDPEILALIRRHRMQQLHLREQQRLELEELRARQRQLRMIRAATAAPEGSCGDPMSQSLQSTHHYHRHQASTLSLPASPPPIMSNSAEASFT
ncbi:hypothetical protein TELCIR_05833 [Teladorsagia circumcincta]|uniref:non-specific serine/threonine protein kinase n=1 Tax=Teladorsagia circumcincta TaxID=45464 RepID=A0A2G9UPS7_TELCI|nr:hypothetical protein TELCIR_05833 [Teladorsagia circumcincta]